jgi:hypothetical protein
MKKMYLITFVFLIVVNIPTIARSSDYDLGSSFNYFYNYTIECHEQSKIVQENIKKYALYDDMERVEIFLDLSHALEASILRLVDIFDMYYLYDQLKSCATDKEKKYIKMKGMQFLGLYKNKKLLETNKSKLHHLQKKKFNDEYKNWTNYINRLSNLCTFLEKSINYNFR